jgi:hypothetical protein
MYRIAAALILSAVTGCSSSDNSVATYPVTGKLLDGGKPVAKATVVFHPATEGTKHPKPRGTTDAAGNFKLSTFATADGAPAGAYRVTVELWLAGRPDEGPANRLPAKLGQPELSGLSATVAAGPNNLEPIELRK